MDGLQSVGHTKLKDYEQGIQGFLNNNKKIIEKSHNICRTVIEAANFICNFCYQEIAFRGQMHRLVS